MNNTKSKQQLNLHFISNFILCVCLCIFHNWSQKIKSIHHLTMVSYHMTYCIIYWDTDEPNGTAIKNQIRFLNAVTISYHRHHQNLYYLYGAEVYMCNTTERVIINLFFGSNYCPFIQLTCVRHIWKFYSLNIMCILCVVVVAVLWIIASDY